MGLWDYKNSVIGEKLCLESSLSVSKDYSKSTDFTEGVFSDMEVEEKKEGRCDSGPKKGKLCVEDDECDVSDDNDVEAPEDIITVSFMTASPRCITGNVSFSFPSWDGTARCHL